MITTAVTLVFCISAIISAVVFHDHHHRKIFTGSIGLVASVAMYGGPLVVVVSHLLFPIVYVIVSHEFQQPASHVYIVSNTMI